MMNFVNLTANYLFIIVIYIYILIINLFNADFHLKIFINKIIIKQSDKNYSHNLKNNKKKIL